MATHSKKNPIPEAATASEADSNNPIPESTPAGKAVSSEPILEAVATSEADSNSPAPEATATSKVDSDKPIPQATATSVVISASESETKTKKSARNTLRQKKVSSPATKTATKAPTSKKTATKKATTKKTDQQPFLQRYFTHLSVAFVGVAACLIGLQSTGCFQPKSSQPAPTPAPAASKAPVAKQVKAVAPIAPPNNAKPQEIVKEPKPQQAFVPVVSKAQIDEHVKTAILAGHPDNAETRERIKEFLATNVIIEHEAKTLGILDDPVLRDRLTTMRFAILTEAVIKADAEKNPVDEKFIRENYDMQKAAYSPREYQLRHIAFKDEASAKKVYKKLVGGADFIGAVQAYTIDNDKVQNGWLGWIKANQLGDGAFRQATISLKKGEFSKPIKTPKAWQIVKLEDVRDLAPFPSFEEQKNRIQVILSQRKAQLRLAEKVKTVQFK